MRLILFGRERGGVTGVTYSCKEEAGRITAILDTHTCRVREIAQLLKRIYIEFNCAPAELWCQRTTLCPNLVAQPILFFEARKKGGLFALVPRHGLRITAKVRFVDSMCRSKSARSAPRSALSLSRAIAWSFFFALREATKRSPARHSTWHARTPAALYVLLCSVRSAACACCCGACVGARSEWLPCYHRQERVTRSGRNTHLCRALFRLNLPPLPTPSWTTDRLG